MWRDKLIEARKTKAATISNKALSDMSNVSSDTLSRLFNPNIPIKEGPGIETIIAVCNAIGIEAWEIFYTGDKSFVGLQAEYTTLKDERDSLVAEKAVLQSENERLRTKVDALKDEIINTHNNYHRLLTYMQKS
jgi:FtsZ-binding cell division protein ZapB/lambda repressor-like predicted transcriptional regulator